MAYMLIDLVKESKFNREAMESVIKLFEPKLKKTLYMTNPNDRDDLEQELKMKMVSYIKEYDTNSVPGFWKFKEKLDKDKEKSS
ncbi:helix-turn-helix domain-containing protein [Bacillota bacterium Lsc_1132]